MLLRCAVRCCCCAVLCCAVALQKLRSWIKSPDCDFILGAGSKGDSDKDHIEGIVSCHAYAILDVVVVPVSVGPTLGPCWQHARQWLAVCDTHLKLVQALWQFRPADNHLVGPSMARARHTTERCAGSWMHGSNSLGATSAAAGFASYICTCCGANAGRYAAAAGQPSRHRLQGVDGHLVQHRHKDMEGAPRGMSEPLSPRCHILALYSDMSTHWHWTHLKLGAGCRIAGIASAAHRQHKRQPAPSFTRVQRQCVANMACHCTVPGVGQT